LKSLAPHLWSIGVLEYWNETQQKLLKLEHLPLRFQYSITPRLQYSVTHCLPNSRRMRKNCCLPPTLKYAINDIMAGLRHLGAHIGQKGPSFELSVLSYRYQIIDFTRPEGEIRVRRTCGYVVEDFE
jgi:hypothetical protein